MFEKEIKFIVDYTLNKLRKEVAHVNMGRLLNSSIHPCIIKYISAEVENQIKSDRNKLLTNSFFDYSSSEISKYFNQIAEEIKQNYKMKNDDLKKLIIKAVSFNANYVVRPGWTLAKFIYNQEKERTIKDVLSYFNYVYYYDYQIKVLSAFLQKRKLDSLSREEFIMISSKIDKEVISSNRKEILKDGIMSIADFFNEGGLSRDKIPPYLLEYYLKDKKFTDASEALKSFYSSDDKQKQPVRDIISRLSTFLKVEISLPELNESAIPQNQEVLETEDVVEDLNEIENQTVSPAEQKLEQLTEGIKVIPAAQNEDYQSTLHSLLQLNNNSNAELKETEAEEEQQFKIHSEAEVELSSDEFEASEQDYIQTESQEFPAADEKKESEDFSFKFYIKEEKKAAEKEVSSNTKNDIFAILSKRETDKIIAALFNDDENEFVNTMDKIIECNSYEKASGILKKVFQINKINPYSKDAILLTTTIANFFSRE